MRKPHRGCVTCDIYKADQYRKVPLGGAHVPKSVGVSVAVDLFSMPSVKYDGKTYDAIPLAVDKHSGWMVGHPPRKKGLTGEQVATKMLHMGGWDVMGIPSYVTSDRGPQFISSWWQTMCSHMGVHHAMAEAYNH